MSLGAIAGVVGAVSGFMGQQSANSAQRAALEFERQKYSDQKAITDKYVGIANLIAELTRQRDAAGGFDPEAYIAQAEADTNRVVSRDLGNRTAAMKMAGYRPGDTAYGQQSTEIVRRGVEDLNRKRLEIGRTLFADKLQAYGAAGSMYTGANSMVGSAGQGYGNALQNDANNKAQNAGAGTGDLIASIMPYLARTQNPAIQFGSSPSVQSLGAGVANRANRFDLSPYKANKR